jgi:hypothetical protein
MSDAVEKLEYLDRTLATEANGITILRSLDRTVLPRELGNYSREFIDALAIVKEIVYHLIDDALRNLLT